MSVHFKTCEHLESFEPKKARAYECEECVKTGDTWVHLRTCQDCGITLCCNSSPNKHMTKHSKSHDHKVVMSAEPGESWAYCYEHDLLKVIK